MTTPPVTYCWCAPPGQIFILPTNPCTWPDCVNGHKPDPNQEEEDE